MIMILWEVCTTLTLKEKKQKKNYILLHEDLGNFERKKIIYILSSTENLFSLL